MRAWRIVWQTEVQNFEAVDVLCKRIRHSPVHDWRTGGIAFQPLPKHLSVLQIVIEADRGQHRLRLVKYRGSVKYVWQQPDTEEHAAAKIGESTSRHGHVNAQRDAVVTLEPKRRVPGDKTEFSAKAEFVVHLNRILGEGLAADVMELFLMRMDEL